MEVNNLQFPPNGPVFPTPESTIEEWQKEFSEPLQGEPVNAFPKGVVFAD